MTQVANDMVRMDIDVHPRDENHETRNELGCRQPIGAIIVIRRNVEYPPALHQGIQHVECHAHDNDGKRHQALAAHQEREHERTLEVMQLKQEQEGQPHQVHASFGESPQQQHGMNNVYYP